MSLLDSSVFFPLSESDSTLGLMAVFLNLSKGFSRSVPTSFLMLSGLSRRSSASVLHSFFVSTTRGLTALVLSKLLSEWSDFLIFSKESPNLASSSSLSDISSFFQRVTGSFLIIFSSFSLTSSAELSLSVDFGSSLIEKGLILDLQLGNLLAGLKSDISLAVPLNWSSLTIFLYLFI